MVAACLTAAAVMMAAGALGRMLLRRARVTTSLNEGVFAHVALGLGALSLLLFFAGLAGGFRRAVMLALLAAIIAFLWGDATLTARRMVQLVRRFLFNWRGWFEGALFFSLAAAAAVTFVSALAPPSETDSLTLHLFVPREYIAAGRMLYLPDNWDSAIAMGPHMLYTLAMLVSGTDLAPAVLHWLVGFVFMLWVWQFTRVRFGIAAGYIAAALLYNVPMVTHVVVAPMIDMFFALYSLAALVWLLKFLERRTLATIALAGVSGAFAAQVKYTGLVIVVAVFAVAALEIALDARRRAACIRALVLGGLVTAVVASPFFIRNWAWSGNPVFPTMKGVFGTAGWDKPEWETLAPDSPRWKPHYGILKHSPANMFLAPWYCTTDVEAAAGGISELIGPAFLTFLPLVVLMRSRRALFRRMGLFVLVVFILTYWLSPRPRTRYFLSLMPSLAAFTGVGLAFLRKHSKPAFRVGQAVILASVATGLTVTMIYTAQFMKAAFGLVSRERFLARATDFHNEYRWMAENLPKGSRILVEATNDLYYSPFPAMRLGTSSGYTLCDSRDVFGMGLAGTKATALEHLWARGITHVFAHEGYVSDPPDCPAARILNEMQAAGRLVKVYEADGTRGTRQPMARGRVERVAIYRIVYAETSV